ncbi:ImmA/IrrE family metallo-endopeptidase [Clostridioides difficile]|nr:ImmA/IrrE family metallo-endopeptidase [Clostridioides difficile]
MSEILLKIAIHNGLIVKRLSLSSKSKGLLKNNKIAISYKLNYKETNFTLAHELSHFILHKGNTLNNSLHKEYEKQANALAILLLKLDNVFYEILENSSNLNSQDY